MSALAFVDVETTGLDPDVHEVWEASLILRKDDVQSEHHWFLPVDLGTAEAKALEIGRYYQRWPSSSLDRPKPATRLGVFDDGYQRWPSSSLDRQKPATRLGVFADEFARLTAGAHLVGAVPSFDAAFLTRLLRANRACPGWHHRLRCVEAMAMGKTGVETRGLAHAAELMGVTVDGSPHEAMTDARTAMAVYDAVMAR